MQEACQVLKKHGCPVKGKLKSELYDSCNYRIVPLKACGSYYLLDVLEHVSNHWVYTV